MQLRATSSFTGRVPTVSSDIDTLISVSTWPNLQGFICQSSLDGSSGDDARRMLYESFLLRLKKRAIVVVVSMIESCYPDVPCVVVLEELVLDILYQLMIHYSKDP